MARRVPQSLSRTILHRPTRPISLTSSPLKCLQYSTSDKPNPDPIPPLHTPQGILEILRQAESLPTPTPPPEPPLTQQVRAGMRRIPHPVMIVHATPPSGEAAGLLVSSFNTVTLTPDPLVSFNIKLPSRTYDAIAAAGSFVASALWDPDAARRFSGYWEKNAPWRAQAPIPDRFGAWLEDRRIWGAECEWVSGKSVEVGDHVVMIGRVTRWIESAPAAEGMEPLVYAEGGYRRVWGSYDKWLKREREERRRGVMVKTVLGGVEKRRRVGEREREEREVEGEEEEEGPSGLRGKGGGSG